MQRLFVVPKGKRVTRAEQLMEQFRDMRRQFADMERRLREELGSTTNPLEAA